ncbi:unnamed protein product [Arabidopsis lyrata]|nr:unnamed protein product [Arabidopsis lyrata]
MIGSKARSAQVWVPLTGSSLLDISNHSDFNGPASLAEVPPFRHSWFSKVFLLKTLNHQVIQVDRSLSRLWYVPLSTT